MDTSSKKRYHLHEFDAREFLDTYFAQSSHRIMFEEVLIFPLQKLRKFLASGKFKLESLIDLSTGPMIFHLLAICEYVKSITVLETNDFCIREMERWINKEEEAFDWSHVIEAFPELEGDSVKWVEKEETLRKGIKKILKVDIDDPKFTETNELEKADCLLSTYLLQHVSKDKDDYCRKLAQLSSLIRVGGHLLLVGGFNKSFFKIGEHTFHSLPMDEDFVMKSLRGTGLTIECFEKLESKLNSDLTDYDGVWFLSAVKVSEQ